VAYTIANIKTAISQGLNDTGLTDFKDDEVTVAAKQALCESVIAARSLVDVVWGVLKNTACTMNISPTNTIVTAAVHGLAVNDRIVFTVLNGGVIPYRSYYVTTVSDTKTFKFSATRGGTTFDLTATCDSSYYVNEYDISPIFEPIMVLANGVVIDGRPEGDSSLRDWPSSPAATITAWRWSDGSRIMIDPPPKATELNGKYLKVWGYMGVDDSLLANTSEIYQLPMPLVKPLCVPLGIALTLENRRGGNPNLELSAAKRKQWSWWVAQARASRKGPGEVSPADLKALQTALTMY